MKILRLTEVIKKTGLSRSSIYKLMKNKEFPLNVQISLRSVGWVDIEVLNWMEDRLKVRDPKEEKTMNVENKWL